MSAFLIFLIHGIHRAFLWTLSLKTQIPFSSDLKIVHVQIRLRKMYICFYYLFGIESYRPRRYEQSTLFWVVAAQKIWIINIMLKGTDEEGMNNQRCVEKCQPRRYEQSLLYWYVQTKKIWTIYIMLKGASLEDMNNKDYVVRCQPRGYEQSLYCKEPGKNIWTIYIMLKGTGQEDMNKCKLCCKVPTKKIWTIYIMSRRQWNPKKFSKVS